MEYRYTLEKSKKKSTCPECLKPNKFVRYIDTSTGNHLPDQYGKCERANNCTYHLSPYHNGYSERVFQQEKPGQFDSWVPKQVPANKILVPCFIPENVLKRSLVDYGTDTLLFNLSAGIGIKRALPKEIIKQIADTYKVGVSNACYKNATTFPFIDINNNIQGIQVKKFDSTNHTEKFKNKDGGYSPKQNTLHKIIAKQCDKEKVLYPEWLNAYLEYQNKGGKILNCFFGEHLLNENNSLPVAVVEAPKTAIVASVYFPQFVWLAVGALDYLTPERCKVLKGRTVVLFPDLNCFDKWNTKAEKLKDIASFTVFPFLEQNASSEDKAKDFDLCDYLLQFDYLEFVQPPEDNQTKPNIQKPVESTAGTTIEPIILNQNLLVPAPVEVWDIDQLESDLQSIDIPEHPIRLNKESVIENPVLFVKAHLSTIKKNNGNRTFLPYYERLRQFIQVQKLVFS